MGTDLYVALDCPPASARNALGALQGTAPAPDDVLTLGKGACVVATPHKAPRAKAGGKLDAAAWKEVTAWVVDLAERAEHADARGVLVVADETALDVQLAAKSYARFVALADGVWLGRGRAPVRAEPSPDRPRRKVATLPKAPARAKLACLVVPRMSGHVARVAAISEAATLADGAGLLVVREPWDDLEAVLSLVAHYGEIATLATDPKGLLAVSGRFFEQARALQSYEAVVARFGARAAGGVRLRVGDLEALRDAVRAASDAAWEDPRAAAVHLAEAKKELRRGGG